jgi:hypothetical protein
MVRNLEILETHINTEEYFILNKNLYSPFFFAEIFFIFATYIGDLKHVRLESA